jgi:hypothetical protein
MSDLSDEFSRSRSAPEPGFPEPVLVEDSGYPAAPPVGDLTAGGSTSGSTGGSTKDTATDQAKQVKDQAVDTTKQVAGVAAEQAQNVASEAKTQTRNVVHEARQQLTDQASTQQNNLASWLFDLVDELEQMSGRRRSAPEGRRPGSRTTSRRTSSPRRAGSPVVGRACSSLSLSPVACWRAGSPGA